MVESDPLRSHAQRAPPWGCAGYLDQRVLFYANGVRARQAEIDQVTRQLQAGLWTAVREPAIVLPTPVMGEPLDVAVVQ